MENRKDLEYNFTTAMGKIVNYLIIGIGTEYDSTVIGLFLVSGIAYVTICFYK